MLEILPALGHLHGSGLLFCDFKLDNVIRTQDSLKLIDLGGVYRHRRRREPGLRDGGLPGARDRAGSGPSVPSDLYTVGRTLALLCIDFKGYQGTFQSTLPPARQRVRSSPQFDSLYRFLLKATAPEPDDRFQSADEMADQLLGVLREVVARRDGHARARTEHAVHGRPPGASRAPRLAPAPRAARRHRRPGGRLSSPRLAATDPAELAELLRAAPDRTVEVDLRLTRALIEAGDLAAADALIERSRQTTRGSGAPSGTAGWSSSPATARGPRSRSSAASTGRCPASWLRSSHSAWRPRRRAFPPRRSGGTTSVSRTDRSYTTATFGLARCCLARGDRAGALEAYDRIESSSSTYTEAQIARIHCLTAADNGGPASVADLTAADAALRGLQLEGEQRARLTAELIEAALGTLQGVDAAPGAGARVAGHPLVERDLRSGLESNYRDLARMASTTSERIRLVDRANHVRPRTWT